MERATCKACARQRPIPLDENGRFKRHYDTPRTRHQELRYICEGSGKLPAEVNGSE